MSGKRAFLDLLKQEGVEIMFGNPGTTELPLMDAFAVELQGQEPVGAPVSILGDGVLAEAHARVAGTINYEVVCGLNADPRRARRVVVDD